MALGAFLTVAVLFMIGVFRAAVAIKVGMAFCAIGAALAIESEVPMTIKIDITSKYQTLFLVNLSLFMFLFPYTRMDGTLGDS